MIKKTKILLVDDQPDLAVANLSAIRDEIEPIHPENLDGEHLKNAALVLVDHQLEDEHWADRNNLPFVGRPMDGLAVASIIRAHLRSVQFERHNCVGIALYSAKLEKVTPHFKNPPEHLAARAADLEWAFSKRDAQTGPSQSVRIKELADAISLLGDRWPSRDPQNNEEAWSDVEKLLGLSLELDWGPSARVQIERCHPPMHEMAEWTYGLAVIRWLSQRVLPYPTFLLDDRHLALRLGIHPKSFQQALESSAALATELQPAKYTGILSDFLGRRWWSTGVDSLIWSATQGKSVSLDDVRAWLQGLTDVKLVELSDEFTLIVGPDSEQTEEIASFDQCVQIQPDDWPPYAKSAWTTIEKARQDKRLRAWVTTLDIEKIN